jgi:protein-L-isoaspartate(D-aspartate) O-methyltransferase
LDQTTGAAANRGAGAWAAAGQGTLHAVVSTATDSRLLREGLATGLRADGLIRSKALDAAFREVPRELFVAEVLAERCLEAVYADEALVTRRDATGQPRSSSSQPALMASMLELLHLRPGHRVLEIGAGTGYNAALMSRIVGSAGRVTSIDVDPAIARSARRSLRSAGYRARIVAGDGRRGHAAGAPYDRIVVTACADAIPTTWFHQLVDGGRLELPLRLDPDGAAIQVIPVLERHGGELRSAGLTWGGFMPLHGGDGGGRPPAATLTAGRTTAGRHTMLTSLSGAGLERLSSAAARRLLAAQLSGPPPAHRRGTTSLSATRPPLLLLYLLLAIPEHRRVSAHAGGRLGVGIVDPRSESLAIVSVRSPWQPGAPERERRTRWRLEAYGGDAAAGELERLLDGWRAHERSGRTALRITGRPRGESVRLRFAWAQSRSAADGSGLQRSSRATRRER